MNTDNNANDNQAPPEQVVDNNNSSITSATNQQPVAEAQEAEVPQVEQQDIGQNVVEQDEVDGGDEGEDNQVT